MSYIVVSSALMKLDGGLMMHSSGWQTLEGEPAYRKEDLK